MNLNLKMILLLCLTFHSRKIEIVAQEVEEVSIVCDSLGYHDREYLGAYYFCYYHAEGFDLVTTPNAVVTSITHPNGTAVATADQVEMLYLYYMNMHYIPQNLTANLPKLRAIEFHQVNLTSVDRESMQQFGDSLESLYFHGTQLTALDDLFKYNWNLRHIYIAASPVQYIDPEFFNTLREMKDIQEIYLGFTCMVGHYLRYRDGDIATFQWDNEKCFDESYRPTTTWAPTTTSIPPSTTEPEICPCLRESTVQKHIHDSGLWITENVIEIERSSQQLIIGEIIRLNENLRNIEQKVDQILDKIETSSSPLRSNGKIIIQI